ncbi:hypothetical protein GCM10009639_01360 [Kitasatospora putterlickiae]|uniref:Acyl-CoA dehydrogenase/oxidase N-terminal domain-containing protein n=1 Tax=Kitasatospora putterlickiae TaxID=221725 RepID=A0ABN1XI55_9ACTN
MQRDLFTEEHEDFRATVRAFLAKEVLPHDDRWEKAGTVDREAWPAVGRQGLLGLAAPEGNLDKIVQKAQDTGELFPQGVRFPKENLLGGLDQGFLHLMRNLAQERLTIAAAAIAGAHVERREAFGQAPARPLRDRRTGHRMPGRPGVRRRPRRRPSTAAPPRS